MFRVFAVASPRYLTFRLKTDSMLLWTRTLSMGDILLGEPGWEDIPMSALVQDF